MRRIILTLSAVLLMASTFGTTVLPGPRNPLNANKIMLPIGTTGKKISLKELSEISLTDLEAQTGRKMNFFERQGFFKLQTKLSGNIHADGTMTHKLEKKVKRFFDGDTGFHFGGFALGFFLGLVGILIAYLIKDDYKHNRVKWAWIGLGVYTLLTLILLLATS
jgi:hypothetical protein